MKNLKRIKIHHEYKAPCDICTHTQGTHANYMMTNYYKESPIWTCYNCDIKIHTSNCIGTYVMYPEIRNFNEYINMER